MLRIVLLLSGCVLLLFQQYILPFNDSTQSIIFLAGILLLGVPHGAADLLVASQNANSSKKSFSKFRFLAVYISRLFAFAAILWLFPLPGILLFILFAAYHFGETDLYQFKTNTLIGKLFVITYGLLILSVILLHHFDEVKPFFQLLIAGNRSTDFLNLLDANRYNIISVSGILFFTTISASSPSVNSSVGAGMDPLIMSAKSTVFLPLKLTSPLVAVSSYLTVFANVGEETAKAAMKRQVLNLIYLSS